MIWSVSTSARSSTVTAPATLRDGLHQLQSRMSTKWPSMAAAAAICGRDEVGAPAAALAALEVAVRGRGAALARAARMSGFIPRHIEQPAVAPVEAGGAEDLVEALRLGLRGAPAAEPGTTIALTRRGAPCGP